MSLIALETRDDRPVHRSFPPALIECIRSGARPSPHQVQSVARHIWSDSCDAQILPKSACPDDSAIAPWMLTLAEAALSGNAVDPAALAEAELID